jgi:hypothetical protein
MRRSGIAPVDRIRCNRGSRTIAPLLLRLPAPPNRTKVGAPGERGAVAGAPLRHLSQHKRRELQMKTVMIRACLALALAVGAATFMLAPTASDAQQSSPKKTDTVKAGKGEKVCRVTLKYSGEKRSWVCKREEPCCVWHEINYVKCGTTWSGCL